MEHLIKFIHILNIYHHKYESLLLRRLVHLQPSFIISLKGNFKTRMFLWKTKISFSLASKHAYFYIYDNNKNLHNLNSQTLSSTKHLFQHGNIRECTTLCTGNSIKFYTFLYTHSDEKATKRVQIRGLSLIKFTTWVNLIFPFSTMPKVKCRSERWYEVFTGIYIIPDIFNLNIVYSLDRVNTQTCCHFQPRLSNLIKASSSCIQHSIIHPQIYGFIRLDTSVSRW